MVVVSSRVIELVSSYSEDFLYNFIRICNQQLLFLFAFRKPVQDEQNF